MNIFECGTAAFRFSSSWAAGLEQAEAELEGEIREFVRPAMIDNERAITDGWVPELLARKG